MEAGMAPTMLTLITILVGGGMGIPLGVPPRAPDPVMVQIAPEKCLYFTTSMGVAEPDADSANQVEQLLAEPEVQAFIAELDRVAKGVFAQMGRRSGPEQAIVFQNAPLALRLLLTRPFTLFVESVAPGRPGWDVRAALVISLGGEDDALQDAVVQLLKTAPGEMRTVTVQGIECLQGRPTPELPLVTVGRRQDYLIVALGEETFEGVLARASAPPPAWLRDAVETLRVPRPAVLSYLNLKGLAQTVLRTDDGRLGRVFEILGLDGYQATLSISGLDETGFVSRTKTIAADPNRGLGKLVSGEPLTAADLAPVPADSTLAAVVRFDAQHALAEGLQLLEDIDAQAAADARQQLAQVKQLTGVDIQSELLAALGDVWTLHCAPGGGGLLAGWTLTVSLKDAQKARALHGQLLEFLNQALGMRLPHPPLRTFRCGEQEAYALEIPDRGAFVAPSWCLTDTHLAVTLIPQTLKSYLAMRPEQPSLATRLEIAQLLGRDQGPSTLVFQDTPNQFVTFYPLVQIGAQLAARQLKRDGLDVNVAELPSIGAIAPHLTPTVTAMRKLHDGFESYTRSSLPGANLGASGPVMVALLLPAVQAAREAARRTQSMNNMKQIGLALHNYHDTFKSFPARGSVDKDGKPLVSWRVFVLPYIEQQTLYEQFHLDEPWDSPHNRALVARMPQVYRSPNSAAEPGKTVYLGNAGPRGVFAPARSQDSPQASVRSGVPISSIRDGTSNTVMLVEADDTAAVIWTRPDDLEFDVDKPLQGLGHLRPGGFLCLVTDGSVQFVSSLVDHRVLGALFTRDGGEALNDF